MFSILYFRYICSVNFRNTLVIFTSNVGSQDILDLDGSDPAQREEMRTRVTNAMKEKFRPEFLNRIDEYVIFNSLGRAALREIVKLEVRRLESRLADKEMTLVITEDALDHLSEVGFDPIYGARPLKRTIQRELETTVARGILDGAFGDGDGITVDVFNGQLEVFKSVDGSYTTAGVGESYDYSNNNNMDYSNSFN
jgi:ATP-dependent Clp protease ATP-binding subunit ClpB